MTRAALILGLTLSAAAAGAQAPPPWDKNACAGLDCGAIVAGVGRAHLLPEVSISSAIAYAQAAKSLAASLSDRMSMNDRFFAENAGQTADSAVKDVSASPLGTTLTKTFGGANSDTLSVAIELKPLPDGVKAFAQEYVDAAQNTLYVRLALSRSHAASDEAALETRLGGGWSPWKGRRIRVSTQDVRAGRQNELTLLVEDLDSGLSWVEEWPRGGADLLQNGQVSSQYVYDRMLSRWIGAQEKQAVDSN